MVRAGTLACACIVLFAGTAAGDHPSPELIADTADRILERSAYSLDNTSDFSIQIVDWLRNRLRDVLEWIADRLGLGSWLGNLSLGTVKLIVGLCLAILLGILAYNGYVLYKMRRTPPESFAQLGTSRTVTAAEMLAEAQRLANEGNFVDASRRLFVAALISLEDKRGGRLRQGLTNSEYLHSFRTDWVRENLRVFVDLINWKWYRHQSFDAEDYRRCRVAYEAIAARLDEMGS